MRPASPAPTTTTRPPCLCAARSRFEDFIGSRYQKGRRRSRFRRSRRLSRAGWPMSPLRSAASPCRAFGDHAGVRRPEGASSPLRVMPTIYRFGLVPISSAFSAGLVERGGANVRVAAQGFLEQLAATFSSIVLARLFPRSSPSALCRRRRSAFASALAKDSALLSASTRVLSLLGTVGREQAWNDRSRSRGHLAVPLLSRESVEGIPV